MILNITNPYSSSSESLDEFHCQLMGRYVKLNIATPMYRTELCVEH